MTHVAAATGSTSERTVREFYGLASWRCSTWAISPAAAQISAAASSARLSLAGGFAKLAKLGQGRMDLHSGRSRLDQAALAQLAMRHGASTHWWRRLRRQHGRPILGLAEAASFPLGDLVAAQARAVSCGVTGPEVAVEVLVVDRQGRIAGRAAGW